MGLSCRIPSGTRLYPARLRVAVHPWKQIRYDLVVCSEVGPESAISGVHTLPTFVEVLEGPLMSDATTDRWLSVDEIAAYLGVKRFTIYKWIERKNMPAHKVGSLWKFKRDEIDAWVRNGDAGESSVSRKPR